MWVYSPLENTVVLQWDRHRYPKGFTIKKGINEIPDAVAQAYFLFGRDEDPEWQNMINDNDQFNMARRHAVYRWHSVLNTDGKTPMPDTKFLADFVLAETREGLEEILKTSEADKPVAAK